MLCHLFGIMLNTYDGGYKIFNLQKDAFPTNISYACEPAGYLQTLNSRDKCHFFRADIKDEHDVIKIARAARFIWDGFQVSGGAGCH